MKKFLNLFTIMIYLCLIFFIISCVYYSFAFMVYNSNKTPVINAAVMFLIYYIFMTVVLILEFSFPYSYKSKYLRILFRVSYYLYIITAILTMFFIGVRDFYLIYLAFVLVTFIFMTIMYIIKIILPKYKKNNDIVVNQNNISEEKGE